MTEQSPFPEIPLMTIRQMCDAYDVTARALRFYEAKGLLAPERRGARRAYTPRDRARLTLILKGKRLGFPLDTIGELLALYGRTDGNRRQIDAALPLAEARLAEMQGQLAELQSAIDEISTDIETFRTALSSEKAA